MHSYSDGTASLHPTIALDDLLQGAFLNGPRQIRTLPCFLPNFLCTWCWSYGQNGLSLQYFFFYFLYHTQWNSRAFLEVFENLWEKEVGIKPRPPTCYTRAPNLGDIFWHLVTTFTVTWTGGHSGFPHYGLESLATELDTKQWLKVVDSGWRQQKDGQNGMF